MRLKLKKVQEIKWRGKIVSTRIPTIYVYDYFMSKVF